MFDLSKLFQPKKNARSIDSSSRVRSVRDTLFGDLPLEEWGKLQPDASEAWTSFSKALGHLDDRNKQGAINALIQITRTPGYESRHYLQAWHALRKLGITPDDVTAKAVYGVLVEVALPHGVDVVVGYADYTARYYNLGTDAGIVWEKPDDSLKPLIDALLKTGQSVAKIIGPWKGARPALPTTNMVRVSMLTPSGLHFGEGPMSVLAKDAMAGPIITEAFQLMQQLMEKVSANRGI